MAQFQCKVFAVEAAEGFCVSNANACPEFPESSVGKIEALGGIVGHQTGKKGAGSDQGDKQSDGSGRVLEKPPQQHAYDWEDDVELFFNCQTPQVQKRLFVGGDGEVIDFTEEF